MKEYGIDIQWTARYQYQQGGSSAYTSTASTRLSILLTGTGSLHWTGKGSRLLRAAFSSSSRMSGMASQRNVLP